MDLRIVPLASTTSPAECPTSRGSSLLAAIGPHTPSRSLGGQGHRSPPLCPRARPPARRTPPNGHRPERNGAREPEFLGRFAIPPGAGASEDEPVPVTSHDLRPAVVAREL
ncbi:hypothetical protein GCM10010231_23600 [Streptomyces sindenensis]|nr:hypothetical protein GCM10010231_23600 [Streptomyces sindenensis]